MKLVTQRIVAASHRLPDHQGKCKNLHGHNWKVKVLVQGSQIKKPGDPQNGMLVDFGNVKKVIDELDHQDLNTLFKDELPPTAEIIAQYLGTRLLHLQDNIERVVVQVWESTDSYIEWDSQEDIVVAIDEEKEIFKPDDANKDIGQEEQEQEDGEQDEGE